MTEQKLEKELVWNIHDIFTYRKKSQKGIDHESYYSDCVLQQDFGPFKKGYVCDIVIDTGSGSCGDFSMHVDVNYDDRHNRKEGMLFVPVWTYVP